MTYNRCSADKPKRGRREKVAPPPPLPEATLSSVIRFSAADLKALAQGARILTLAQDLDAKALALSRLMSQHVIWGLTDDAGASQSDVSAWAAAVSRWASEGMTLIGGGAPEHWRGASSTASRHLLAKIYNDAEFPAELLFMLPQALERDGRDIASSAKINTVENLRGLIRRMPAALEVLRVLSSNVAEPARPKKNHDAERKALIRDLQGPFEDLHPGTRFTAMSTGIEKSRVARENERYGPSLDWCRSMFRLATERIEGGLEPPPDAHIMRAVIEDLARWAQKPHALAEYIRELRPKNGNG
jgi:hypothetical protein